MLLDILGMDITRFIQVFVVQLGLGIVFLLIGIKILKRDRKRLNQIIGGFYIFVFIGMLINVIYAPLKINPLVTNLHLLTDFFLFLPSVLLLVFNLIVLKSQKIINTKIQMLLILVWAGLLSVLFFIPNGVTINESTQWKPVWSLTFALYVLIIATGYWLIPVLISAINVSKAFKDPLLKKKWNYYIIAVVANGIIFYGTSISNFLNQASFRNIWAMFSLLLMIITSVGVYKGLGQQMAKK